MNEQENEPKDADARFLSFLMRYEESRGNAALADHWQTELVARDLQTQVETLEQRWCDRQATRLAQ